MRLAAQTIDLKQNFSKQVFGYFLVEKSDKEKKIPEKMELAERDCFLMRCHRVWNLQMGKFEKVQYVRKSQNETQMLQLICIDFLQIDNFGLFCTFKVSKFRFWILRNRQRRSEKKKASQQDIAESFYEQGAIQPFRNG